MNLAIKKADRGFVTEGDEINWATRTNDEIIDLLRSRIAFERTIGADCLVVGEMCR